MDAYERIRATTVIGLTWKGNTVIGSDGQVTVGQTVMKQTARKVRRLYNGKVLAGFAGAAADAFTLFAKFEEHLEKHGGNLERSAVEMAKEWRTDKYLRHLEALLAVLTQDQGLIISGTGEIVHPDDGIVAIGSGGEEQGLLGSEYYAVTPVYPLARTLAHINMDGLNVYGRTKDVEIVGYGASDLDDYANAVAAEQGRVVKPEAEPEKGRYYRSDHFPFAKRGVPALNAGAGLEYEGQPADYGQKKRDAYTANDYHAPSDEIKPDWNLAGASQDCEFYFKIGYRVANATKWPEWAPTNEFKATRDAMLKKAGAASR